MAGILSMPGKAQGPAGIRDLTMPDGSRFLLVPSGESPLIHWVTATPAGSAEDPPEYPGLSYAVARASLNGTSEIGSKDWPAEELAIITGEDLRLELEQVQAAGEVPDGALLAGIEKSRLLANQLSDPYAWRRELQTAPALQLEFSEANTVSFLEITTTAVGFSKVASLMKKRRDNAELRGLREILAQVQKEEAARQRHPLAGLRREILELALPGRKTAIGTQGRNLYRVGKEMFQLSQVPQRCLHVIAGGFDPDQVQRELEAVFVSAPETSPVLRAPEGWGTRKEKELISEIPGGDRQAIAMAFEVPRDANPQALSILVDWLTGGPDSFLARELRRDEHLGLRTQGQAPFPATAVPGLLLVEVWEERLPGLGAAPRELLGSIRKVLDDAAETGPSQIEFNQAVARARGRRGRALASPLDLAYHLALSCSVLRQEPEEAMRDTLSVTHEEVRQLARQILRENTRSIVNAKRQR